MTGSRASAVPGTWDCKQPDESPSLRIPHCKLCCHPGERLEISSRHQVEVVNSSCSCFTQISNLDSATSIKSKVQSEAFFFTSFYFPVTKHCILFISSHFVYIHRMLLSAARPWWPGLLSCITPSFCINAFLNNKLEIRKHKKMTIQNDLLLRVSAFTYYSHVKQQDGRFNHL